MNSSNTETIQSVKRKSLHGKTSGNRTKRVSKALILHAGMHKTGSSSIQVSLHYNLKSDRVNYIDFGVANHSGHLKKIFTGETKTKDAETARQKLITSIEASQAELDIISGEGLLGFKKPELQSLKDFVSPYYDEIKVVAYIRAPHSYLQSAFQQKLKYFDPTLQKSTESHEPDLKILDSVLLSYKSKLKSLDEVFGSENVQYWKFEPKVFPKGNIVLDFCKKLNFKFAANDCIRMNSSLSREAISLLYTYYAYAKKPPKRSERIALLQILLNTKGNKFILSHSMTQPILSKERGQITWLENRSGLSLGESSKDSENALRSESQLIQESTKSLFIIKSHCRKYGLYNRMKRITSPEDISKLLSKLIKRKIKLDKIL